VSNLGVWHVETFHPLMKVRSRPKSFGISRSIIKPLFNGYVFARFRADTMLHDICYTRGVHSVVSFGRNPSYIDDEIIAMFKSQVREDGLVRIGDELKVGEKVFIKEGPFKN